MKFEQKYEQAIDRFYMTTFGSSKHDAMLEILQMDTDERFDKLLSVKHKTKKSSDPDKDPMEQIIEICENMEADIRGLYSKDPRDAAISKLDVSTLSHDELFKQRFGMEKD